jgi:hypothetical protein
MGLLVVEQRNALGPVVQDYRAFMDECRQAIETEIIPFYFDVFVCAGMR